MKLKYDWNAWNLTSGVSVYHLRRARYRALMDRQDSFKPTASLSIGDEEYDLIGGWVSTSNPYAMWDWHGVKREELVADVDAGKSGAEGRLAEYDKARSKQDQYDKSGYEFCFGSYKEEIEDLIADVQSAKYPYPMFHPMKRVRDLVLDAWQIKYDGPGKIEGSQANWCWGGSDTKNGGECTISIVENPARPGIVHGLVEFDAGVLRGMRR